MSVDAAQLRSGKGSGDENFPVASWLVEPRHRRPILAFYEFVRIADDIADHAKLREDEKLAHLDRLEASLLGRDDSNPAGVTLRAALQERNIRYTSDLFVESLFDAESAYRRVELLFRSHADVAGLYVNSLLPMDGLVRFFGEQPETCRPVHYGVFDYHPMMDLLVDLHIGAIRQNPEQMVHRAWEIFTAPAPRPQERIHHHVPYELIVAPKMRRFLPETRRVAVRGRPREVAP